MILKIVEGRYINVDINNPLIYKTMMSNIPKSYVRSLENSGFNLKDSIIPYEVREKFIYNNHIERLITLANEEIIELYENYYNLNEDMEEIEYEIIDNLNFALLISSALIHFRLTSMEDRFEEKSILIDITEIRESTLDPQRLLLEHLRSLTKVQEIFWVRKYRKGVLYREDKIKPDSHINELIYNLIKSSIMLTRISHRLNFKDTEVINKMIRSKLKI